MNVYFLSTLLFLPVFIQGTSPLDKSPPRIPPPPKCVDKVVNCHEYKAVCGNSDINRFMKENCQKTCGHCEKGQTCPPPFEEVKGTCLYMGTDNMSWKDAKDFCVTIGIQGGAEAHLAIFPTCEEFTLATHWLQLNTIGAQDSDLWVGAGRESSYRYTWWWLTGEQLQTGVPMWAYSEGYDDGRYCASMSKNFRYKLSSSVCDELKQPLCQVRPAPANVAAVPKPKEKLICPNESVLVGNHCYEFHLQEEDFDQARENCSRDGKQLFFPEDCDEFTDVAGKLHIMVQEWSFWVGAVDATGFGDWTTINGEHVPGGAPYWAYDQPKHEPVDEPLKYCGYMGHLQRYYLAEDRCNERHQYICKVQPDTHP